MEGSIPMYSVLYLLEQYLLPVERGIRYKIPRTVQSCACAHLEVIHGSQGIRGLLEKYPTVFFYANT